MSIIRDESLRDHARTVQAGYAANAESLVEFSADRQISRDLFPADPRARLPKEISDAKAEYEAATSVRLNILKYARTRNGELEDAVDDGNPLPEDPVQLTRSITVSSSQGAIVILEQWLAAAEPDDGQDAGGEG